MEQYARRAGLEPNKTLDLGNGVKMEMVLIPAGKFAMGTEEPEPVDEAAFQKKIMTGQIALAVGGLALLAMIGVVAGRAIRRKMRPQFSLGYLIVMVLVAGIGVMGGTRWWESERAFDEAKADYQAAAARFKEADDSEKPAHSVTLTKPFYIGRFEVTQDQYVHVAGENPSQFSQPRGQGLPVVLVSWDDAQEFCREVGKKTGLTVRLPTEAEWEHACRAGTRTMYCTGDTEADLDRVAWYDKNSGNRAHPVGQKAPNAWGVHDMHGNVWEWCADRYADYGTGAVTDPQGPAEGADRVLRGGSWGIDPGGCRSANRGGSSPDARGDRHGFRVVGSLPRAP